MTKLITGYHGKIFQKQNRLKITKRLVKCLRRFPKRVGIVCTGLSGILPTITVANETNREYAIVRKSGESTHSTCTIEGYTFDEFIIIDDFIDRGATLKRILREMHKRNPEAVCRGIILYDETEYSKTFKYRGKQYPVLQIQNMKFK